jgi:hypothetical protein
MPLTDSSDLIKGCRWVAALDDATDTQGIADRLGFEVPRFFWLTAIAPGQWRGRHAHRESTLATFAPSGACRIALEDGTRKQDVELKEGGPGLIIGPWIWHDLYDFLPGTVVLVAASSRYSEAEYIRDYDTFLREAARR